MPKLWPVHTIEELLYLVEKKLSNWLWKLLIFLQGLTPYEKKKYVWKMLYVYMLGYDVDFGHMEAVSLISAPKYPEKQVIVFLVNFFIGLYQFLWLVARNHLWSSISWLQSMVFTLHMSQIIERFCFLIDRSDYY